MLILIGLILIGVGLIALSVAVLQRRQATTRRQVAEGSYSDGEREVYDRLYGKRSMTVSAPKPVEPRSVADADRPKAGRPE